MIERETSTLTSTSATTTCPKGAGPVGQTASELGKCTCCNSSQSHEQEAPGSDRLHEVFCHFQRFSSPAQRNSSNRLNTTFQSVTYLLKPNPKKFFTPLVSGDNKLDSEPL